MNGRDKRQTRRERRRNTPPAPKTIRDPFARKCPNGCGEAGPHFVPPSLGDPGFYTCTSAVGDRR